jgi:succinate dehydrogenase/fumarate reductase flavoprotein subunit
VSRPGLGATPIELTTDVLVIGAGAAGMMAARSASDEGASVVLVDKSIIGRGGATVLAQMTVAVALGEAEPDSPAIHANDTMIGSRGLADPEIVGLVVESAPADIHRLEGYGVDWARTPDGLHRQVAAPGHSRRRCVFVDMLKTGEGVAAALRKVTRRDPGIVRLQNAMITRLVRSADGVLGAVGVTLADLAPLWISASRVVIASGGLTKMYARSSASSNMTGDGILLAARAGATVSDLEMVQFFPIAHLYPPLIHLDPIMWDPFRYKLGGRLINGLGEEFMEAVTGEVAGRYTATRDDTTRAIYAEVQAGRGSPHGGVFLDFRATLPAELQEAFGPVIRILADQGIDLTRDTIEVAPMAHFLLGGIHVDTSMRTDVPGLLACGEAIAGMHGANRLSGNAITEAAVTGRVAGATAAADRRPRVDQTSVARAGREELDRLIEFWHPRDVPHDEALVGAYTDQFRQLAWETIGPLRTGDVLHEARARFRRLREEVDDIGLACERTFPLSLQEKLELCTMLVLAEGIALGAEQRKETRGAHVRVDFLDALPVASNTRFRLGSDDEWLIESTPAAASAEPA